MASGQVFCCEIICGIIEERKANDGDRQVSRCAFRQAGELEIHQLEAGSRCGQKTADAYRKGSEREKVQEGKIPAMASHSFVLCKTVGYKTRYLQ